MGRKSDLSVRFLPAEGAVSCGISPAASGPYFVVTSGAIEVLDLFASCSGRLVVNVPSSRSNISLGILK